MKKILLIYTNTNKRSKTRNAILTFFHLFFDPATNRPLQIVKKTLTCEESILHR